MKSYEQIESEAQDFTSWMVNLFGGNELDEGNYRTFTIHTNSMFDKQDYYSTMEKSKVFGREIDKSEWNEFLLFSERGYIIILNSGTVLFKDIVDFNKSEIKCHSRNPLLRNSDFDLPLTDVSQIYRVVLRTGL